MKIYISKDILNNKDIDDTALAVYVALRSIYNMDKDLYYVTSTMLCYELYGNSAFTKYTRTTITEAIEKLAAAGLISVQEKLSKTEYILDLSNLFIQSDQEYYVILDLDEVHTIFNITGNVDKFALLRYFACMIGTINITDFVYTNDYDEGTISNFVGYMTIDYIASIAGVSVPGAKNYNKILEQNKLIYIYRHSFYNEENGQIKSMTNHYGRYVYKKYITMFAQEYEQQTDKNNNVVVAKKDANTNRSLTQKYNAFRAGTEYTYEEVQELYAMVKEKNEQCRKIIVGCTDDKAVKKASRELKDESIFEEYFKEHDMEKKERPSRKNIPPTITQSVLLGIWGIWDETKDRELIREYVGAEADVNISDAGIDVLLGLKDKQMAL